MRIESGGMLSQHFKWARACYTHAILNLHIKHKQPVSRHASGRGQIFVCLWSIFLVNIYNESYILHEMFSVPKRVLNVLVATKKIQTSTFFAMFEASMIRNRFGAQMQWWPTLCSHYRLVLQLVHTSFHILSLLIFCQTKKMSQFIRVHTPNSPLLPLAQPSSGMYLSPYTTTLRSRRSFTPSQLNFLPPPSVSPIHANLSNKGKKMRDNYTQMTPETQPMNSSLILSSTQKSMKKIRSTAK